MILEQHFKECAHTHTHAHTHTQVLLAGKSMHLVERMGKVGVADGGTPGPRRGS